MNYHEACNILNLSNNFTNKQLKNNYYMLALQYHPDRNIDKDTKTEFSRVKSRNARAGETVLSSKIIKELDGKQE